MGLDAAGELNPTDLSVRTLGDFLAGYGASGGIARGQLQHDLYVNQWDIFAQDQVPGKQYPDAEL